MKKTMKKMLGLAVISLLLVCTLITVHAQEDTAPPLLISPAPSATASSAVTVGNLTVNKTQFAIGEPIYVTAYGEGSDWVAIYKKTGSDTAYRYYYIEEENASGVTVDITQCASKNKQSLTHGNYMLYYYEDGNFAPKHKIEITIGAGDPVTAPRSPISVTYEHKNVKPYLADGTVTVELSSEGDPAGELYGYWSRGGNKLKDYTELFKCTVPEGATTVTIELRSGILIPEDAKGIVVFTSNTKGALFSREGALPETVKPLSTGEEIISLQIVADTHANETNNSSTNIKNMFTDISRNDTDSVGVFVVGDVADNGVIEQYELFNKIQASVKGAPVRSYWVVGNHDYWQGRNHASGVRNLTYQQMVDQFNSTNGNDSDKPYYDLWIDGYHFIFIGYEEGGVAISKTQEAWLAEKLAEDASEDKPIFIFLHQPFANTVAGSYEYEGYTTLHPRETLQKLLASYPQAMMFTGHGHDSISYPNTMLTPTDAHCHLFNTGAIIGSQTNNYRADGKELKVSEGYYVSIYENYVVLRGRDFTNSKWIPTAQFVVHYDGSDLHFASEEVKAQVRAEIAAKAPEEPPVTTANPTQTQDPAGVEGSKTSSSQLTGVAIVAIAVVAVAAICGVAVGVNIAKKRKASKS